MYILTSIILCLLFLMIKKTKEKQNFLLWIVLTLLLSMTYISFICFIFTYLYIPITSLCISIFNCIISIILFICLKKFGTQKYYFKKLDILGLLVLFLIVFLVFLGLYSTDFFIKSVTPDGAAHFLGARTFFLNTSLNMSPISYNQCDYNKFQFLGIVNLGMIFKDFGINNTIFQYKIYSIYTIFLLLLSGLCFFLLLNKRYDSKKNYIIALFVSVIFMLGYPLIALTYGFFYWLLGGIIIIGIILLCNIYTKENVNKNFLIIILSLYSFGLFCSYYMFVPIVYLSLFIFIINYYIKEKSISKKECMKFISIVLIIPFILGYCHFILDTFKNIQDIKTASSSPGRNYNNLFDNFIIILPFAIHGYSIIRKDSKKFVNSLFLITIIFIFFCFYLMIKDIMSLYYFCKIYLILWILFLYFTYVSIINLLKNNKYIVYILIFIYIISMLYSIINIKNFLNNQIYEVYEINTISSIYDVFNKNYHILSTNDNMILDKNLIHELDYIIKNKEKLVNKNNEINVIGSYWQKRWFDVLTDIVPKVGYNGNIIEYYDAVDFDEWEKSDSKYLIIINYKLFKNYYSKYEKHNSLFKGESLLILEKKD